MNSEAEKLCLKLTDFQENAALALKTLREDKEFADVTLVCEDGQQVEAHKVILASSSPFFLNLLRMNNHPHPLIYMRGIKSEDLLAAVDFLYFGAANIHEEKLESFLALAEELQLKGLVGSGTEEETEEADIKPLAKQETPEPDHLSTYEPQTPDISTSRIQSPIIIETEAVANYTVAADLQNLDEKVKSMMETRGNRDRNHKFARRCKVCGKEGPYSAMRDHIEAHHITGVSHTCHICGITVSKSRKGLAQHIRKVHSSG